MQMIADEGDDPGVTGDDALTATLVGAAAGAVVYPAYKVLKPKSSKVGRRFEIGDDGFRLRLLSD